MNVMKIVMILLGNDDDGDGHNIDGDDDDEADDYEAKNANIWPKMPILGQIWPFLGPKLNFWGQGVKLLVHSYRESNETPFSC